MHRSLSIAVRAALLVALAGCGGDDTGATAAAAVTTASEAATAKTPPGQRSPRPSTTGGAAEASGELCALVTELFELEGPSVEQLERYQQLAPEPIADAVNKVTEPLINSKAISSSPSRSSPTTTSSRHRRNRHLRRGDLRDPPLRGGRAARGLDPRDRADAVHADVSATDYAFRIGDVAAGRTSFVLTNDGEETHEMISSSSPRG